MNKRGEHTAATQKSSARLASIHQERARNRRLLAVLGCVAVLATAFALMLPALSMTRGALVCDLEEHTHTKACYEQVLVCGQEEGEGADSETGEGGHVHTKECYEKQLTCGKAEHKHTDACYEQVTSDESADKGEGGSASGDADSSAGDAGSGADSQDAAGDGSSSDADSSSGESEAADQSASSESASSVGALEPGAEADMPAQSFKADLKDAKGKVTLTVEVEAPQGAFPAGTFMKIDGVAANKIEGAVEKAVAKKTDGKVTKIQAVDITFREGDTEGKEIEPARDITVKLTSKLIAETEKPLVVHVDDKGKADVVDTLTKKQLKKRDLKAEDDQLLFDADKFSTYGIVVTTLEQTLTASDGNNYTVTVTAPAEAGVPENAELVVEEIGSESGEYEQYVARTEEALGWDVGSISYARLFDIRIVGADGNEIQPAEGSSVHVDVKLGDKDGDADSQVVHFGESTEVLDVQIDGDIVSFDTTGFSVYSIVEAPDIQYEEGGEHVVDSLQAIADFAAQGFYVSNKKYYLTGGVVSGVTSNSDRYGLAATESTYNSIPDEAAKFFFEPVEGSTNQFFIYTVDGEQRRYVQMSRVSGNNARAGLNFVENEDARTAFTLEKGNSNTFCVSANVGGTTYFWNRNANDPGAGAIVGYSNKSDKNTAWIELRYVTETINDPYSLNGESFGIAYYNESTTASALTAEAKTASNQARLEGLDMLVRPDVLDNEGVLLVAEGTDIQEWTFVSQGEDKYYLTTTVDNQTKYLTVNGGDVTLADEPSDGSLIKATPGTGANAGKWRFSVNNRSLNFSGSSANGFNVATGNGGTTWMNLVKKSEMGDDDFIRYAAKKVSVSDNTQVYDGKQVVIYTRVWNESAKRYDFYAVDHDGSLIKCYDIGDGIEWIGNTINTATWDFTEYTNSDGTPNYYYELQNSQLGEYIAPQVTGGQVLSDSTIGVNLNGRRYGRSYTTIVAWDDNNYSYAGLKVQDGRLVSCPLAEADDFYFAIVDPTIMEEEETTTVETVDNGKYGITMKAVDFNNTKMNDRDSVQTDYLGLNTDIPGLLSTDLGDDGYPTVTASTNQNGNSLGGLFAGTDTYPLTDVNHLFIQNIYNESGYFEYDSTQNFAHLEDNGDYTVYNQLAQVGNDNGKTRAHGQFMPYNELVEGQFSTVTNRTDVLGNELPISDPRKGEKLYSINPKDADFFFGMEMEAGFTQTANGLDAWGHDIIFEFSGDDDFWFYVDNELVLDLGGVHSAMTGSINFRTGVVTSSRGNSTLYDIFLSNYQARGMSENEIERKLHETFEEKIVDGVTVHVFKDYSDHTMRMFYMERGAGASNLHMRFNLAAVKPGTFILDKKLSDADNPNNDLIEFPYQIYYKDSEGVEHLLPKSDGNIDYVKYQDTTVSVKYKEAHTPSGGTQSYQNVFFLKPGEAAEVTLPEGARTYRVVECGVNPSVYDQVSVNGTVLNGVDAYDTTTTNKVNNVARHDYTTPEYVMGETSKVSLDNHVADGAMRVLSITKQLYDSDGETLLHYDAVQGEREDKTPFSYRLYLGDESTSDQNLPSANSYPYFVKSRDDNYCRWDASQQKFVSLGITDYDDLKTYLDTVSAAEKDTVIFKTSPNGSITKIPADYTVEVRDLIVDAKFMVEERVDEIPRGYTLRLEDGYKRIDEDHEYNSRTTPISGTIEVNVDPKLQVNNQKGWGLTVNKVWTDADFMVEHDPIYFAVFKRKNEHSNEHAWELVDDTVRQLKSGDTSIYYFFNSLQGMEFGQYAVLEVTLRVPHGMTLDVKPDGTVRFNDGTEELIPRHQDISIIPEGETLSIGGQSVTDSEYQQTGYNYKVSYDQGEITDETVNVRVDTVTNSRPGIELKKTDWSGNPLSGAKFELKRDGEEGSMGAKAFTSNQNGLITIAYLPAGSYTLTETEAPGSYVGLNEPLTIAVDGDSHITSVSGSDSSLCSFVNHEENDSMAATITVKNHSSDLVVKKIDSSTTTAIKGVHFALYPQVTDINGNKVKALRPLAGYEDCVTNDNGILTEIGLALGAGTYYLTETQAVEGYERYKDDLCFTIGKDGGVSIEGDFGRDWLATETNATTGEVSYSITIPNSKNKKVSFKKVDIGNDGSVLAGAKFDFYRVRDGSRETPALYTGLTSRASDGLLAESSGTNTVFELPIGTYHLVETEAPAGYNMLTNAVEVTVSANGVICNDGTAASSGEENVSYDEQSKVFTLKISNSAGVELPMTGGMGTWPLYLLGIGFMLLAGGMLVARRRPLAVLSRELAYTRARDKLGRRVYQHKGFTRIVATRRNRRRPR